MKYEKYSFINENNLQDFEKLHNKKLNDPYNDQYHLSSYSVLINDPNGLIYHEETYYIYMQNTPYSDDHKNKSWLLYTTKDFINYVYEGIVLTPSCDFDKHGVFSGGAFVNENNEIDLYYTGNIKGKNNKRISNTLIANVDFKNKKVNKKLLFQTDLSLYTGEFRDPNIVKKGENIFMLNGAQNNDKKGVLSIYKRENNLWKYLKDIKLDLRCEQNSFMVECPNYFKIDNREFILSCLEQDMDYRYGGHFVQFREWKVNNDFEVEFINNLEKLDYGYDFYAPKIFQNLKDRVIMLGWLGNSRSNHKFEEERGRSNQLTVPRELFIKDNLLHQKPIKELENLRKNKLTKINKEINYENGSLEIILKNNLKDFSIVISNDNGKEVSIKNENNKLIINRLNMDFIDEKNLPSEIIFEKEIVSKVHILIDKSSIEIFINEGRYTLTTRIFLENHNKVTTDIEELEIYQLAKNNIEYNNIIFENNFIK